MPHPRVARTKFDLIIDIDGTEFRCAQVTANFYLNKIPMASATLAVGRNVRTLEAANAHSFLFLEDSGTTMLKEATIRIVPAGEWKPMGEEWDSAIVFRGYVTGVGVRTMRGSIRPTVQIIHWLADLNFASALSEQSHPANPADLAWAATHVGPRQQTSVDKPHFLLQTTLSELFSAEPIQQDFWGSCLKPLMVDLSAQDQIEALPGLGIGPSDNGNAQAAAALDRMPTDDVDYVPLSLHLNSTYDFEMADAIADYMTFQLARSWWSSTLWSKLVNELSAAFMFAVVPQVEQALVVPYIPGTRTLWKTISSNDYNYIDTVGVIPRPIKAVAIYAGINSETSADGVANTTRSLGVGGYFRPEGADKGMLLALRPSGWLTRVPAFGQNAGKTLFGDPFGNPKTTPDAFCHDAEPAKGNEKGHTIEDVAIGCKEVHDRLAHAIYVQEVLRGRFGVLHGKLRFDIAPGSTVLVEGSSDPFISDDNLRPNLVGEVHRVTCSLNAEGSKAGTSLQLAHLRTEKENESDVTSVDLHPMYNKVFAGSPLIEALAFRSEAEGQDNDNG
jgi:hypothetical protein